MIHLARNGTWFEIAGNQGRDLLLARRIKDGNQAGGHGVKKPSWAALEVARAAGALPVGILIAWWSLTFAVVDDPPVKGQLVAGTGLADLGRLPRGSAKL